ncbi:unnamed protein product, partial [Cercopithifilaria johnstoni]
SVKEEIFLTEIEKGLDCISDDDKELDPTVVSFDDTSFFFIEFLSFEICLEIALIKGENTGTISNRYA